IDIGKVPSDLAASNGINTLLLFSESASRFLVEVAPEQQTIFEAYMRSQGAEAFACIGEVTGTGRFQVHNGQHMLIDIPVTTLQAKNLVIHLGEQLRRFIDEGRPVLGICNGFQALVRAGLLPGRGQAVAPTMDGPSDSPGCSLTDNASAQFECRWITLSVQPS